MASICGCVFMVHPTSISMGCIVATGLIAVPIVLGVCRRILRDAHAAEDAFQATFLVLARKAGSLRRPELLGNWLYGVACRTARKARGAAARRRAREGPMGDEPHAAGPPADETRPDVRAVLDQELERLPERYRAPLVLY